MVQAPWAKTRKERRRAIVPFTREQSLDVTCIDHRDERRTFAACDEVLRSLTTEKPALD